MLYRPSLAVGLSDTASSSAFFVTTQLVIPLTSYAISAADHERPVKAGKSPHHSGSLLQCLQYWSSVSSPEQMLLPAMLSSGAVCYSATW